MADMFYSEKIYDGSWTCCAVVHISTEKFNFTNEALSELMTEFYGDGCSYEIIFENPDGHKINCFLVIRQVGVELEALQNSFDTLIKNLINRLIYEGFQVERKDIQESGDIITRLGERRQVYMCVPGVKTVDFPLCYIPGGYLNVDRLEFGYILSLLNKAEGAGISFQLNTTGLLDIERQRICENIDWLWNTYGDSAEAQYAMDSYRSYLTLAEERLYFTCITFWGDDEVASKISHSIANKGYGVQRLPLDQLYKHNYLTEGNGILTNYATAAGHILPVEKVVPQGCERLDYLVVPSMIDKMIDLAEIMDNIRRGLGEENVTIPDDFRDNRGLELGKEVYGGEKLYLPVGQLAKHMTIAGMSGSGKTTLLFKLLIECNNKKIPFLVIEPTKTEHRELIDVIPDFRVFTPGKTNVSPVMFNPFLPPENITLEQYLPSLISAFQLAFSMTTPLDVIFAEAVRNCYAAYGWRNDSTRNSKGAIQFGMHEFICAFKEEINNSSYDYESKQNLNSGGVYRLQSLINNNPYLFDTDKTMDFVSLLSGNTLIELDAIDNQEQKALFMSLLLLQLKLVIRQTQAKDSILKNVILLDEAHVLLDNVETSHEKNEADAGGKIEAYLLDMVKVNRVYGTGMIFADQSLAILKSFVNNSNIKVAMHLESYEEREFLTNNLNLSEKMYNKIANLGVGQFYISCERTDKPLLIQMEDVRKLYGIPHDVGDEHVVEKMGEKHEMPFLSCACDKCCDIDIRNEAEFIARNVSNKIVSSVHVSGDIDERTKKKIQKMIAVMASGYDNEERLICCAGMMTERMLKRKAVIAEEIDG